MTLRMAKRKILRKTKELARRLAFYLKRDRFDRELEAEMRFHLEMKGRDKSDSGLKGQEAELAALRQFGNVALLRERSRDMWAIRWADELARDVRYGVRMIRKSPIVASVIVLSLAMAIGANTAIFSVFGAVVLRTLPVKAPNQLVLFEWSGSDSAIDDHSGSRRKDPKTGKLIGSSLTYQQFQRMGEANQTLSDLFAFAPIYNKLNVSVDGHADVATGQFVSGGYYSGLGVEAILGRTITENDDKDGAEPVAVISYRYWKKGFDLDPGVVGKRAYINAVSFMIIGISPQGFEGALDAGQTADVSLPLSTEALVDRRPAREAIAWDWWLRVMGRLKPGTDVEQARLNLEPVFQRTALEAHQLYLAKNPYPKAEEAIAPTLRAESGSRGGTFFRTDYSKPLYILLAIVGLVLLIACVNTANLLLARSGARAKEIGVRIALGAGRIRLIRQLLTESLILSMAGGLAGLALAYWVKDALVVTMPWQNSGGIDPRLDPMVLAFTAAVSVATGIFFGIAPAMRATRVDPGPALKEHSAAQTSGRVRISIGKTLVTMQVALSVVILVGAGLFLRTLRNLQQVDPGFNPSNLLLFDLNPSLNGYKGENLSSLYRQVSERISGIPGVQSQSMSEFALLSGAGWGAGGLTISGAAVQPDQNAGVYLLPVKDNFLDAMQIPVLLGRSLKASDEANSNPVAVVNQAFVKLGFKDQNPIGKKFKLEHSHHIGELEIVGVARDTRYDDMRSDPEPQVYLPYSQVIPALDAHASGMTVEVRTEKDPLSLVPLIRQAVQSVASNLAISDIRTQQAQIDSSMGNERLFAGLTGALGALVLLLVCLGLYGVMSYNVSRRTGEIGIRIALGAKASDVIAHVMSETMGFVAIGVVLGIAGSLAATRLASASLIGLQTGDSGLLFGVTPKDPFTLTAATLCLLLVAATAGCLPARRASQVDPLTALRYE